MDVILDRGSTPLTSIKKKDSLRVLFLYVIKRPLGSIAQIKRDFASLSPPRLIDMSRLWLTKTVRLF